MAEEKTAVNPVTGGVTYGGTATIPAAGTPAGPTTPAPTGNTLTVPNVTNPSEGFPTLPDSVSSRILPGGSQLGAEPATKGKTGRPFDEQHLVDELAKSLKVKAKSGGNLETAVIEALAKQHGVKIPKPTQTEGTGTGQGTVGQARHNIASWFETALQVHLPGAAPEDGGGPPGTPRPVQSKKALNDMLTEVAAKLGIQGAGPHALADVTKAEGLPTTKGATAGTPATPGGPQTVGQAYQAFQSSGFDKKGALTATGTAMATDLVNAGIIDQSQATNAQAVAGGYAQVLTESAQQNKTTTDIIQAGAAVNPSVGQAQSEWSSYVQGVATEFGVALTDQQVNDISSQYYKEAVASGVTSVQDGPSSMTDAIKNSVVSLYDPNNPNDPAGVASQIFQGIKSAALSYGIPLADGQLSQYVKTALQGATVASMYVAKQSAIDQYTKIFQDQASSLYPTIAPQIQAGIPVSTIVQPYNSLTQQYTGKDAASILTDPTDQYSKFLQGGQDPKTGAPTMMSLDQWKKTLMSDPSYGFQNTQGGKNLASQFSSAILNEFGKINTGSNNQGAFSSISPSSALSANS